MEYKILEQSDIKLMKYFLDDEKTEYDEALLNAFLKEKNSYGFVAKEDDVIVGFAYGYILIRPDGLRDFYLHAIDIMENISESTLNHKIQSSTTGYLSIQYYHLY